MALDFMLTALVTLLVVVDPVGLVPAFIGMTHGLPARARRQVALRACLIAFCILLGSMLAGDWLLRHLGIGLPAFRIAGGLLLFAIAFEMAFGLRVERETRTAEQAVHERVRNIAAFPLAIPLLAGPGAITATILLTGRAYGDLAALAGLVAVVTLVMLVSLVVFMFAGRIAKLLGVTGNIVLSRLLGVILAALAVQFVIDGIRAAWA